MTTDPLLANPPTPTLRTRLQDAFEFGMFRLLRHAPIDLVSDVGSAVVRWNVPRNRPHIIANARDNLARLRPDLAPAAVDAGVARFLDNVGRMMGEFACLERLGATDRIEVSQAFERDLATLQARPTLVLMLHLGNWEVFGCALQARGVSVTSFAIPPETWAQRVIASRVRRALGIRILSPDLSGLRRANDLLEEGACVAIFADEARLGRSMAPLFGRPPHRRGNLAIAARLARDTGARVCVCYAVRKDKARFRLDTTGYVEMPDTSTRERREQGLVDVAFLNSLVEPIVQRHLDQWYFLDDALDPVRDRVSGAPAS